MTSKRQQYLLVCLILLAGGILTPAGVHLARAASVALPLPTNLTAVAPPAPMPSFTLPSPNGVTMRSADLQNKIVVIRFWATW